MIKKNIMLVSISIMLMCLCIGCGNSIRKAEEHAQEFANSMENENLEEINQIIFGYHELELSEEIAILFVNENQEGKGILEEIFKRNSVEVIGIDKSEIEYRIQAPNLSRIFEGLIENGSTFSEDDFINYLKNYIVQAELQETTISVSYTISDGKVKADYQNPEFINAITGNLLESYRSVYQEMMREYLEGE